MLPNADEVKKHLETFTDKELISLKKEFDGTTVADDAVLRGIIAKFYGEGIFFLQIQEIMFILLNVMAERFEAYSNYMLPHIS